MADGLDGLRRRMRRQIAPLARRIGVGGRYRGNIDAFINGEMIGWAARAADGAGRLTVGLFTLDGLLATASASIQRNDVRDAGIGDGACGFVFRLDETMLTAARQAGGTLIVRVMDGGGGHEIGRWQIPGSAPRDAAGRGGSRLAVSAANEPHAAQCRGLLYYDLVTWRRLLSELDQAGGEPAPPPLERHARLFEPAADWPAAQEGRQLEPMAAYLEYTKFRTRKERDFDTEASREDRDHFLDWYVGSYGVIRNGLRPPLPREAVAHLNELLVMGGQKVPLTRLMWWRLLRRPQEEIAGALADLADPARVTRVLYWWAWEEARKLFVEDFAVTDRHAEMLAAVPVSRKDDVWPFSPFLDHYHAANPQLHFLSPASPGDRRVVTLTLMLAAATRPDVLRYLPRRSVERALEPQPGGSELERFFRAVALSDEPLPRERYAAALRMQGFDLERRRFLFATPDGHRLLAAAMPRPAGEPVDVQIIGPFEKASGLGQATRLSAAALDRTGLSVNRVNFGLDNPAPEGFSTASAASTRYRPARINLIHLNAESVPLVFAYEPDVFSGAYNIGYFFWELDSPALCHYLAFDLLDEIWVSSDYGVSIYRPEAKGRPVVNVGMAYEDPPAIDRAAARALLNRRLGLKGDEFVVLTTFDSYSFVQRKNPLGVIEAFRRAFGDRPQARLLIKTQNRTNVFDPVQERIWNRVDAALAADPRILLLNETLDYRALIELKAACDAYVSLHRSEGWGFGMIEAMALGVPVVCTGYSGNLEFCSEETAWLVNSREIMLAPDDYIFVRRGQKWADPDLDHAARQLRTLHDDPALRAARAAAAQRRVRQDFSLDAIARRYGARLRELLKEH
ncbi:Glycosyltransferase [Rubellimicrobium thermophilum DSM 16684]|uniref:Glycosyltransferase n=2 Tax=Rubellimicrobium TaxID=295418 RepID=S9QSY5_9RHOB|nr:Glycosyltransferase [Rubellimicrobium thermophilum DSM 16684]